MANDPNNLALNAEKRAERRIREILNHAILTPEQAKTLQAFEKFQRREEGRGAGTRLGYLTRLVGSTPKEERTEPLAFVDYIGTKRFEDVSREDYINFMEQQRKQVRVGKMTYRTFKQKSNQLTRFIRFLHNRDEKGQLFDQEKGKIPREFDSPIWRWRPNSTKSGTQQNGVRRKDLITEQEMNQLLKVCGSTQYQAMLALLIDGGPRIEREMLSMRIKDVWQTIDEDGKLLETYMVRFKDREIEVYECVYRLQLWLDAHPDVDNPEAPLWPAEENPTIPITYPTFKKRLSRWCAKTGITQRRKKAKLKKITPHLFRHTSATLAAAREPDEFYLRDRFGWKEGSAMAGRYCHLAGAEDFRIKVRRMYGLPVQEKAKAKKVLDDKIIPRAEWNGLKKQLEQLSEKTTELETKKELKALKKEMNGLARMVPQLVTTDSLEFIKQDRQTDMQIMEYRINKKLAKLTNLVEEHLIKAGEIAEE